MFVCVIRTYLRERKAAREYRNANHGRPILFLVLSLSTSLFPAILSLSVKLPQRTQLFRSVLHFFFVLHFTQRRERPCGVTERCFCVQGGEEREREECLCMCWFGLIRFMDVVGDTDTVRIKSLLFLILSCSICGFPPADTTKYIS